jgi:pilus assembly protein FimV
VEHYSDSQFDDDLTVGLDDGEFGSSEDDLDDLLYSPDENDESLDRLKTLILSIDWEITDEYLLDLDEETKRLREVWESNQYVCTYLQLLEKLGKYIYKNKTKAHPRAAHLLLLFFYNLEKLATNPDIDDKQKKLISRGDLKKFEKLKDFISKSKKSSIEPDGSPVSSQLLTSHDTATPPVLLNLKASILALEWEITDLSLHDLSKELRELEQSFSGIKSRLLFLRAMDSIGGYIKLKRSNAHVDSFNLLDSLYIGLEKIVSQRLSAAEKRAIIDPEVEKFAEFKRLILPTIDDDSSDRQTTQIAGLDGVTDADSDGEFSHFMNREQTSAEHTELQDDLANRLDVLFDSPKDQDVDQFADPSDVDDYSTGFSEETLKTVDSFFSDEAFGESVEPIDEEKILRGVNVESEADDDTEEDALPTTADGTIAPALVDEEELANENFPTPAVSIQETASDGTDEQPGITLGDGDDEVQAALAGVDIDSEIPGEDDQFDILDLESVSTLSDQDEEDSGEDIAQALTPALSDFEDEHLADDSDEAYPVDLDTDLAPALSEYDDEHEIDEDDGEFPGELEKRLDFFFGEQDGDDEFIAEGDAAEAAAELDPISDGIAEKPLPADQPDDLDEFTSDADEEDVFFAELTPALAGFAEEPDDSSDICEEDEEPEVEVIFDEQETPFHDISVEADGVVPEEEGEPAAVITPAEFKDEKSDETEELVVADFFIEEQESDETIAVVPVVGEPIEVPAPLLEGIDQNLFNGLSDGIEALAIDIDDEINDYISLEIDGIQNSLKNDPTAAIFVTLMQTVNQHIKTYGFKAQADSHTLLSSVFTAFRTIYSEPTDFSRLQLEVREQTGKVLAWQQEIIEALASSILNAETLISSTQNVVAPVSSGFADATATEVPAYQAETSAQSELRDIDNDGFADSLALIGAVDEDVSAAEDSDSSILPQVEQTYEGSGDSSLLDHTEKISNGEQGDTITEFVRQEIEALRISLLAEIKSLRKQLEP